MDRARSFRYALEGWWYVIRTQRNAWIHALISIAVVVLAIWLETSRTDWIALILAMMVVWTAEFTNTAVESAVDLASPHSNPLAKIAKDVAAGAVLISACGAVLIGLLVLGPPLWQRIVG